VSFRLSVAPSVTVPVTSTWSCPVPGVVPAISTENVVPFCRSKSPLAISPGLNPGLSTAPDALTVRVPSTVGSPVRVTAWLTSTFSL